MFKKIKQRITFLFKGTLKYQMQLGSKEYDHFSSNVTNINRQIGMKPLLHCQYS